MNPLSSLPEYEHFIYTLQSAGTYIQHSTLVVVRRGATIAVVSGEVVWAEGFRLVAREQLSFTQLPGRIQRYGYEVWQGEQQLYWYDSQPHPDNPALASTHPHHKHIPPNIKKNRVPAPNMSFTQPNLPALIAEIEALLAVQP